MAQRKLDHLADSLDLAVKPTDVLVGDDRYSFLLGCGLAHHLNDRRFCNLDGTVRTCPRGDQRDSATEDAEKGHVTLHERHVHEPSLYKANKFLVNAQSHVSGSEDDGLGVLNLSFFDRDIFV